MSRQGWGVATMALVLWSSAAGGAEAAQVSSSVLSSGPGTATFGLAITTGDAAERLTIRVTPEPMPLPFIGSPVQTSGPVALDGPGTLSEQPVAAAQGFSYVPSPPCIRGFARLNQPDVRFFTIDAPAQTHVVLRVPTTLAATPMLPGQLQALRFQVTGDATNGNVISPSAPIAGARPGVRVTLNAQGTGQVEPAINGRGGSVVHVRRGDMVAYSGTTVPPRPRAKIVLEAVGLGSDAVSFPPVWKPPKARKLATLRTDGAGRFLGIQPLSRRSQSLLVRARTVGPGADRSCGVLVTTSPPGALAKPVRS